MKVNILSSNLLIVTLISMGLFGCGGSSEPATPPPAPAPAPAAAPIVVQPPATKEVSKEAPIVSAAVVVPQPDLYLVNQTGAKPNYRITRMKKNSPEDIFSVKIPPQNFNSSMFRIALVPPKEMKKERNPAFVVPQGYLELPEYGYAEDGIPHRIKNPFLETQMVYVPPGVVTIGKQNGFENAPPLNVYLDGYYIDVHEITVKDYLLFRKKQQVENKRVPLSLPNATDPETKPALGIHWGQARAMLREFGKDLPTEAEWEKAARGPQSFPNPWGYGPPLWPSYRDINVISEVGIHSKDVSPYGVFDMAGNAKEWCLDYYAPDAYKQAAKQDSTPKNWMGPKQANPKNTKVVRGSVGNWDITYRQGISFSEGSPDVGFRGVIRSASQADTKSNKPETNKPEAGNNKPPSNPSTN